MHRHGFLKCAWQRLELALSVGLALWLGLFPVVQALHLRFADHNHCFCPEHSRIEDLPRADRSTNRPAELEDEARFRASRAVAASSPDLLLNFHLQASCARRGPPTAIPHASFQPIAPRLPDRIASSPDLLVAPKTSPPSIAAC